MYQTPAPTDRQPPETLYLAAGCFGHAVAQRLQAHHRGRIHDVAPGTHPSMWPYAETLVLATGAERPRIADAVDHTCFLRGIPWIHVVARSAEIQVGPVVIPGRTACYRCSERRRRQHRLALPSSHPDRDSAENPSEFAVLKHHISLAAALTRQAFSEIAEAASGGPAEGTVRSVNLVSGTVTAAPTVGTDNCARCRGRFGPKHEARQALWGELESAIGGQQQHTQTPELQEAAR
ncbi:TOMM precursor leader peptide-binding protein [Nesterenkonia alkaliphila]|uniref:TOMM leader peptide-binding protein n=1 Tax=Nesterenkonia alkaliphila TaxID=1463631 RepID=A0A7K1UJ64_9MICC|nr:TOMM precursor leader peptide-binding protein [Nesterenkonia alkaliphila]MVT26528.1 TOMM precursor leader peptide-binding protein [Nesterenkonia alkaliphila]GFZ79118.1 hypothetical protein GCM10011359_04380 [Nesterenkonia alkaliphila]